MHTANRLYVGVSDKLLMPWLEKKTYLDCSDEGEAVAIAAGHWLATNRRAVAFMSADGLCNALNFLTSWVVPEEIQMDLVISTGRMEPPHKEMTRILPDLIKLINANPEKVSIRLVHKKP